MKKRIAALVLVLMMALALTACGSTKEVVHLSVYGVDEYEIVEIPDGLVNFSMTDDEIIVTVQDSGEYDFVICDEDGTEYEISLVYDSAAHSIEVSHDDTIEVDVDLE